MLHKTAHMNHKEHTQIKVLTYVDILNYVILFISKSNRKAHVACPDMSVIKERSEWSIDRTLTEQIEHHYYRTSQ